MLCRETRCKARFLFRDPFIFNSCRTIVVLLPLHLRMYCDAAQSVLEKKKKIDQLHDTVKTAPIHAYTVKNKEVLVLQLSNEMQLSIMNKVKSGELSIEDALNQARRDQQQLLSLKNQNDEVRDSLKNVVLLNS